jgi:mannose-6-phosphate isomerase
MNDHSLYPLLFEPQFRYRPWGGQRLAALLNVEVPARPPTGEAWLLSDRDDHSSRISNGRLIGQTLGQVIDQWAELLLGSELVRARQFPILLKFLDVREALSVQVHPSDAQAATLSLSDSGKTEAWVVVEAGARARIYAGLVPGTTEVNLREAVARDTVPDRLSSFVPKPGDAVLIPAKTVHSLRDVVVFEIQENSDVTLRLFDWNRVEEETHERRPLQVEQAIACIDFAPSVIGPTIPSVMQQAPVFREQLFDDAHFQVWRMRSRKSFIVGSAGRPRVLVGLEGEGEVAFDGEAYLLRRGGVMLLPAVVGTCPCQPHGDLCLLEIGLRQGVLQ